MIQVQPFNIDILSTHRGFFILDQLPQNATEVDVWIQTPTGNESVDFVDVFSYNGVLIAAWNHPFQKLPLHNLTVFCNGVTQVLNLYPLERIIDIYNRPLDGQVGAFSFTNSVPVNGGDWRCDRGMYGAKAFTQENIDRVFTEVNEIVVYEPFLCINGVAHLIYVEGKNKTQLADEKLNNSVVPTTGRTLQETLRLIYEWSLLVDEPFNSTDEAAVQAKAFLSGLKLSTEEMAVLSSLPPMQISNYLAGSQTARVRPSTAPELNDAVKTIVFKRMACSSLSKLLSIHGMDVPTEIYQREVQELDAGLERFNSYYTEAMSNLEKAFYDNQIRFFRNKKTVLDSI